MSEPTGSLTRAVTVTITFPIKNQNNLTDRAWTAIDEAIDRFVDDAVRETVLDSGAEIDVWFARNVEPREPRKRG